MSLSTSVPPNERVERGSRPFWRGGAGLVLPTTGWLHERALARALWLAGGIVASAVMLVLTRGTTFFYDEWDFILYQRSGIASLFVGHNGHWSTVPLLVYRLLFATVGLSDYVPYRVANVAFVLLCSLGVYLYGERRTRPLLAMVFAVSVLFLGDAWQDLLWPFQIGYLASLAFGIFSFVLIDRERTSSDLVATLFLVLAVSSSGIGLMFVGAMSLELLLRRAWRRLFVAVVPVVVYLAWYVADGTSEGSLSNLRQAPGYIGQAAGSALGSLVDLSTHAGLVVVLVIAGAALVSIVLRAANRVRLLVLCLAGLAFWVSLVIARAENGDPTASRYLLPGAVFVLLALVELAKGFRQSLVVVAGLAALLTVGAVGAATTYRGGAGSLRYDDAIVRAELRSLELLKGRVPASFEPDTSVMPQVSAGPYYAAVRALGSPADTSAQVLGGGPTLASAADAVLLKALDPAPRVLRSAEVRGPRPKVLNASRGARVSTTTSCVSLAPGALGAVVVELSSPKVVVHTSGVPATLWARRFSRSFASAPLARLGAHELASFDFPRLGLNRAWVLKVSSEGAFSICSE